MDKTKQLDTASVFSLDYEGRGVARVGGKTVFIKGALPSENVRFCVTKSKKQFDEAETVEIMQPSAERVIPKCSHFATCGGCVLQHLSPDAQVATKQRILEEQLQRIGKVLPEQLLPPIYGLPWYYRNRARLSVEQNSDGTVSLGFQAKRSNRVVNINRCEILPEHVSAQIIPLRSLLQNLADGGEHIRFAEFYKSEKLTILNIGLKNMPSENMQKRLKTWFDQHLAQQAETWQIWLQCGREPALAFYPENLLPLSYRLKEFSIEMPYLPGDFTQINADLNALMVARAVRLLDLQPDETAADLFCGLGNFSLPMAKTGAKVTGIEGSETLVARAKNNAERNGLAAKTDFQTADLFETTEQTVASWGTFDKMLLDPPRNGAYAVVKSLHAPYLPKKIVYISCNPSTFARDAAVLVKKGYRFKAAGVMNMFAQTAHVESVGVFELAQN